ncbi:MAG: TonB-dependent receptor [Ferruginibacter sp.]|nr:TonB-dependent receptor [Cytophagales bacterium]
MKKAFYAHLFVLALPVLLATFPAFAQRATVSGHVKDAATGEDLIGAGIAVRATGQGTATNAYGFYSLTLPADSVTLVISYLGYTDEIKAVRLNKNLVLDVALVSQSRQLREVVVSANSLREKINATQMSVEQITTREAKLIPAIFGEVDILKVLQLKPGIKSGGEGTSGLYVRGGGPDQNLVVLDEAVVYNANHLFGFFSVFNSDAVKGVDLYKGDFPAQFGGRLSSVVDVKLRDGNAKKFAGSGGLGLISSRLTLEGPLVKDKSSFMVAGRRTYFDLFTRQYNRANANKEDFNPIPNYHFYDLNAKVNYRLGERDRLYASGYFGRDVFEFNQDRFKVNFDWGNTTATLRWNHVFGPRLFANTSLILSDYQYNIRNRLDVFSFSLGSRITDYTAKVDFDYLPNNRHTLKFGAQYTHHRFGIGRFRFASDDGRLDIKQGQDLQGTEVGAYLNDDVNLSGRLRLNAGLRLSGFVNEGKTFGGVEPRLAARYKLTENTSLKASAARMYQYVHLVANSGASLPTDVWYPSNRVVDPQRSDQVAGGVSFLLFDGKFLLTNEGYYKWMRRQIDFRDGANLFVNDNLDAEFVFGRGWSYGNELYFEKKEGRTTGWVGYTLSWTYRQFADISGGEPFFPRYDRRHDASVVVMHELSKRISLSATWVYNTGNAYSLPAGRFTLQDVNGVPFRVIPVYPDQRNTERLAPYSRLDLGLVWRFKPRWGESDLTFSVYNAYNRRNAFFVFFDEVRNDEDTVITEFQLKQVSLFPIIGTLTYNFKF